MLMGVGGALVEGNPSPHMNVENTCVTCHLQEYNHSFAPSVSACVECHTDAEDFNINGTEEEIEALMDELEAALLARGLLAEEELTPEDEYLVEAGLLHVGHPHPVPGEYPEAEAAALWNWIFVALEDTSHGIHNPSYTRALLEASLEALGE